ncbi:hypothetical protein KPH14_012768 [Odynerus spinipes]|uniref:Gag protein n=1 Tax=Odynerus spinipes TaxID=1348599 RepID=A0AAD9R949_9HYME|nr:hypothetical protein KPH14_012768 [Odynerus spinipes]
MVAKLHYLKTSVTGTAAQLISNVPMSHESFDVAWNLIKERFDDKERLILSYVEKLFSNTTQVNRTAHDLNTLVSSTKETLDALKALDVPLEHWNYVLLYTLTRRLDSTMREAWEVKRSSLPRPTTVDQLIDFIQARARALEAIQSPSQSTYSSRIKSVKEPLTPKTRAAHYATTQPATAQYPCDLCRGAHYIVSCPKFRELHPTDRHKLVVNQRLCFNCLGHHNLSACNSSRTCKTCGAKHHTMIHLPSSIPQHQLATAQRRPQPLCDGLNQLSHYLKEMRRRCAISPV